MDRRSWLLGLLGCASMQAKNVPEVIAADPELQPLSLAPLLEPTTREAI